MQQRGGDIMEKLVEFLKTQAVFWLISTSVGLFFWLGDQRLHRTILYIALVSWAMAWIRRVSPRLWRLPFRDWLVASMLIYMGWQWISLGWSPIFSVEELFEVMRKSVLAGLFVAMMASVLTVPTWSRKLWIVVVLSAVTAALLSMALFWWQPTAIDIETGRMTGIGRAENPIQAAALYGMALIVAGYFLMQWRCEGLLSRGVMLVCWAVLALALVLTQGRGAMLAALAAHGVLLWHGGMPRRHLWYFIATGSAVFACSWLWVDWLAVLARADSFRLLIWGEALAGWMASPVFGLGYRMPFFAELPYGHVVSQTHSVYVGALYYGGMIGLGVLLLMIGVTGLRLYQCRHHSFAPLYLALWLYGVVFGLVDFDLLLVSADVEWLLFWLPIAAAFACNHVTGRQANAYTA